MRFFCACFQAQAREMCLRGFLQSLDCFHFQSLDCVISGVCQNNKNLVLSRVLCNHNVSKWVNWKILICNCHFVMQFLVTVCGISELKLCTQTIFNPLAFLRHSGIPRLCAALSCCFCVLYQGLPRWFWYCQRTLSNGAQSQTWSW